MTKKNQTTSLESDAQAPQTPQPFPGLKSLDEVRAKQAALEKQ